jgi:glycerophosphoryl diester phosphodiesterase
MQARLFRRGAPILLCALGMSLVCAAQEVLLRESFDNAAAGGLPSGWTSPTGGWTVRDGALHGAAPKGKRETTVYFGDADWRDVAVQVDLRFESAREPTRWFAILVRDAGPERPGIQLTTRQDTRRSNGLEIAAKRPQASGGGWKVFQTVRGPISFQDKKSHRLRIEARGPWLRGLLDGEKVIQSPRAGEVAPSGRIGLRVSGAAVVVDNVEVVRLPAATKREAAAAVTRPLVIAHRGFSAKAPENTLASYQLAIDAGAQMAECDVRLTKDGVPVLLHDADLERTTGVAGKLAQRTLAEIRELDAGSWKAPEFAGQRIPTLAEALELTNGRLRFVIEIKDKGIEKQVVEVIRSAGVDPASLMIFCFQRETVANIARLEPLLPTTWLVGDLPYRDDDRRGVLRDALRARVSALGLPLSKVDPDFVRLAHESGLPIFVWTINDPDDMRFLIRIGVDGIITDHPDVLLRLLGRAK